MGEITEAISVAVPVEVAYAQWTQFESFPHFMEGVERVRQLDDRTLEWTARIAGRRRSWRAVITDQTPARRIAWRSVDGAVNAGDVDFEPDGAGARVRLHLVYGVEGPLEAAGDAVGLVGRRVRADLERFKEFVEARRRPTGSWNGEIHQPAPEGAANPEA